MKSLSALNNSVVLISSYPPRECGIATFSQDLANSLREQHSDSFEVEICALEKGNSSREYPNEVSFVLNSSNKNEYKALAIEINNNSGIKAVLIQHEFGLFGGEYGDYLLHFIDYLKKPLLVTFHTVLPFPDAKRFEVISKIAASSDRIIVMTKHSSRILIDDYTVSPEKISLIPHGTHPIIYEDRNVLKQKFGFENRKIVSTFGLISSNKNIENALESLPAVTEIHSDILYLIIGKTHPEVIKNEGEIYREMLKEKVESLRLQNHVFFINEFLETSELLELLQLSDTYIFTSKDRNQAVSGTFAYAMSAGCPVIATAIPHAKELLSESGGILIDFENPLQLSNALLQLLGNEKLRNQIGMNAIHTSKAFEWKSVSLKYALLLEKYVTKKSLKYNLPAISLEHLERMTHTFGIVQFCKINTPDYSSGYTLDDNARALIAVCMNQERIQNNDNIILIAKYLHFINSCMKENGQFFNYLDSNGLEHEQNDLENLQDSNGRAILALATVVNNRTILPENIAIQAELLLKKAILTVEKMDSPRAIAFSIKGLYFYSIYSNSSIISDLIFQLGSILSKKYYQEKEEGWEWFEDNLTYGNSILPEALLYAHLSTKNSHFKAIAKKTFDFLLDHLFLDGTIKVITNNGWLQKGEIRKMDGGEQPIDVAYTIQSLQLFHLVFQEEHYREKMETAFSWFLGNNHLKQMLYNPKTAGCHDGLEKYNVNLNQGAESTICYLIARLCMEKTRNNKPITESKIGIKKLQTELPTIERTSVQI